MRTIFIADAHLNLPEDNNYRQMLRFLGELEGGVDTLYILGDLFDFWLGFPSNPFIQYNAIVNALERLVVQGCKLVYFEGNHDFHLGHIFLERLKAEIYTEPATLTIQGKRLYISHGDQINREDYSYRILRFMLRTGLISACVRHFPPVCGQKIRELLQKRSKAGYQHKTAHWDYRQILLEFAESLRKEGYDGLVTGHFHLAICENIPGCQFKLLSLGDWMEQFTYGEMDNGILYLKQYAPPTF